jgi:uncharacterized membrane protein
MSDDRRIEDWLRRMNWALGRMPSPEREDIMAETRAHLRERLDGGQDAEAALAALGPPDVYARRFIDEMELSGALGSQKSSDLLRVVLRRVHRSLVAAVAFVALLFIGGIGVGFPIVALCKLADPTHFGLWVGPYNFSIGSNESPDVHEVLGDYFYPMAVVATGLAWVLGRMVLLWAARTIRGR